MCEKPFIEDIDDLEAFRRLSPRDRIEQLTLALETDEDIIDKVKDDLYNKAQQEESATRKSMYKFLLHGSCGVADN